MEECLVLMGSDSDQIDQIGSLQKQENENHPDKIEFTNCIADEGKSQKESPGTEH